VPPFYSVLLLLVVAWGAFAFGAPYDWAYTPLFWGCAALGALGLWAPGSRARRPVAWPLAISLAIVAAVGLVQLIPLAPATIARLSPATDVFLRQFDVAYQVAAASGAPGYTHALSIAPSSTWLGLAALVALSLLMTGAARGLGHRSLRTLASGLVFVGFAVALAGIVQSGLYTRDPNPVLKIYGFWQTVNKNTSPFGPFVNRNHFAGWMLIALPVAMGYFTALVARGMRGLDRGRGRSAGAEAGWAEAAGPAVTFRDRVLWFSSSDASRVILVGLAVLVMALSLVLTLSRSGTTCFLIALAITGWFVVRRVSAGTRRHVSLVYVGLLAAFSVGWAGLDVIIARFSAAGTDFWSRFDIWEDTWRIFRAFPWLGSGLNTFGTATVIYQTTQLGTHHVEAHNDYLQLLSEGGIVLALAALAAIVLLAGEIRRRFRDDADDQATYWIRVGATTGLVAIALQSVAEFSLQMPGIAALFAIVSAMAIWRPGSATPGD
jgi:O-antigen ligase